MSTRNEPTPSGQPRDCPIADALGLIGDRWSLLIVRELFLENPRFSAIRVNTGAPREILTARLRKLEAEGIIARRRYSERPPRDEYVLTAAGRELGPVIAALYSWGERHARVGR